MSYVCIWYLHRSISCYSDATLLFPLVSANPAICVHIVNELCGKLFHNMGTSPLCFLTLRALISRCHLAHGRCIVNVHRGKCLCRLIWSGSSSLLTCLSAYFTTSFITVQPTSERTVSTITTAMRRLLSFPDSGAPLSSVVGFQTDYCFLVAGNYLVQ